MAIRIPDVKIAANLSAAQFPTDVRGPDGEMLGRFIPSSSLGMTYPESGLTDDELDKLTTDPNAKWKTPEEVTARLQEIDQCSSAKIVRVIRIHHYGKQR